MERGSISSTERYITKIGDSCIDLILQTNFSSLYIASILPIAMSLFILRRALWVFPLPFLHFHIFKTRLRKASLAQNKAYHFSFPLTQFTPPGIRSSLGTPRTAQGPTPQAWPRTGPALGTVSLSCRRLESPMCGVCERLLSNPCPYVFLRRSLVRVLSGLVASTSVLLEPCTFL